MFGMFRKPHRLFLFALLFLGILLAGWALSSNDAIAVKTINVEQGPIQATIAVTGRIVSKQQVAISASIAGHVRGVHVKEGDKVPYGALLAQLDDREAQAQLMKSEADLRRAEEEAQQAARNYERTQKLFEVGAEARQTVDDAKAQHESARARLQVAHEEVRLTRLNVQKMQIRAPFAGNITEKSVQVGQWAAPGQPLLTLADLNQREIEAKVDVGDSAAIRKGQDAQISSDAYPGKVWVEKVVELASAVQKDETANTFRVRLTLSKDAPALRLGQQVDVKIRVASKPDAVKVPFTALVTHEGKTAVAVVQDGRVQFVPVETGLEDPTHTEIVQGIRPGQQVILPEGKTFKPGEKVVASKPAQ